MSAAWRRLLEEIGRARDAGRTVEFWWRDDDAARPDPALDRLLAIAGGCKVPLALAAIPALAEAAAFASLPAGVAVLQHGSDHRNRAGAGEKKTEFPAGEAPDAAIERLASARRRLESGARRRERLRVAEWRRHRRRRQCSGHLQQLHGAGNVRIARRATAAPRAALGIAGVAHDRRAVRRRSSSRRR